MHRIQRILLLACFVVLLSQAAVTAAPMNVSDMGISRFTYAVDQLGSQQGIQTHFANYMRLTPSGDKIGPYDVYPLDYSDGSHRVLILYLTHDASYIERISVLWPVDDETSMNNAGDLVDLMLGIIGLTKAEGDALASQGNDASVWCTSANRRIHLHLSKSDEVYDATITYEDS